MTSCIKLSTKTKGEGQPSQSCRILIGVVSVSSDLCGDGEDEWRHVGDDSE